MIVYLHGFRSSPQSTKAQRLKAHMEARGLGHLFWCGQLPPSPSAAIALAEKQIAASATPVTVVGSSLGGYYATHLAEKHRLKAVLVNPAVVAHLSLAEFVGPQTNLYTGETFEFRPEYIDALCAIEVTRISRPQDFLLLVETGDEVLDYRQAVAKYAGARQAVLEGGDHSFTRWPDYLDEVLRFAGLLT
ncbi:MAG: YqiA/YcfP family alpha/beta fold hydrolase [Denitratisoma sp.]|nr:YqiA/YcfP family alpha/beta fold hydrolase [Denitratisoma sp.]